MDHSRSFGSFYLLVRQGLGSSQLGLMIDVTTCFLMWKSSYVVFVGCGSRPMWCLLDVKVVLCGVCVMWWSFYVVFVECGCCPVWCLYDVTVVICGVFRV